MDIVPAIQIDNHQQAIQPEKLTELYRAWHDDQTSDHYKARHLLMLFLSKKKYISTSYVTYYIIRQLASGSSY